MSGGITRSQAAQAISDGVSDEDDAKKAALRKAEAERVEIDGRKAFYWLRSKWSWAISVWISALVWFNCYLAYKVGTQQWTFDGYEWFITAVTVETFLQVIGLGYVAAKFLFSRG